MIDLDRLLRGLIKMAKLRNSAVLDMIQQKYPGYHPLMAIADIANNTEKDTGITWDLRYQCHKTIARFVEPELKTIEVKQTDTRRQVTISLFGEDPDEEIVEIAERDHAMITVK